MGSELLAVTGILEPEGVGDSIEERKQGSNVNRLCDLLVTPSRLPKSVDVGIPNLMRVMSDELDEFQQRSLFIGESTDVQSPSPQGECNLRVPILQLQEMTMCANSVRAVIKTGHERGDHFLRPAVQETI